MTNEGEWWCRVDASFWLGPHLVRRTPFVDLGPRPASTNTRTRHVRVRPRLAAAQCGREAHSGADAETPALSQGDRIRPTTATRSIPTAHTHARTHASGGAAQRGREREVYGSEPVSLEGWSGVGPAAEPKPPRGRGRGPGKDRGPKWRWRGRLQPRRGSWEQSSAVVPAWARLPRRWKILVEKGSNKQNYFDFKIRFFFTWSTS